MFNAVRVRITLVIIWMEGYFLLERGLLFTMSALTEHIMSIEANYKWFAQLFFLFKMSLIHFGSSACLSVSVEYFVNGQKRVWEWGRLVWHHHRLITQGFCMIMLACSYCLDRPCLWLIIDLCKETIVKRHWNIRLSQFTLANMWRWLTVVVATFVSP